MSLFNELKRRNVFRVGVAYLIGAWLLAQIADLLIDNIGAPDWVMKTLFVALALGFFLSLFFAWAFEMTPEGVKRESEVDRSQSITNVTGRKLDRSIIVILLLALGYFAWDKFSTDTQPVVSPVVEQEAIGKSIAVLPFVNMSADENNEYFSDGLSEELLNLLAKVDGLKVAARTSSFKFRNSEADISEIGEKLNVATVLEGSVRKSGNQVRITAQLIKVNDGFHLWSETYDRNLDNIFEVQDEIASAIVDALKLPLLGQNEAPIASKQTANFEAYDLYLLGRFHQRKYNAAGFEQAAEYYNRAVAVDPGYAPAWAGLADAYMLLSDYGTLPFAEATSLAEKAVERALSLDSNLPEALNAKATLLSYQGQFSKATEVLEQALTIDPNNENTLLSLAQRINEIDPARGLALAQKAWNLDPLAEETRSSLIENTGRTGDRAGAEALIRTMLMDDPENPGLYEAWSNLYAVQGLIDQAIQMMEMTHRLRPGDVYPAWRIVFYYLLLDDLESAGTWLAMARDRGPDSRHTINAEIGISAYKKEWETAANQRANQIKDGDSTSNTHYFYGLTLMRLNRQTEAEQQFRRALSLANPESIELITDNEAKATAQLINILPPGPERDSHLSRFDTFMQRVTATRVFDWDVHVMAAYQATFRNDRDAALAELRTAFEKGLRGRWYIEVDPVLQQWTNDPQFIELMLEMKQEATRMRGLLEAAKQAGTMPVYKGNGQ
jgi:TolB-like protein/Flp pilus assembly protein TadD